jgi:hypothetical protein
MGSCLINKLFWKVNRCPRVARANPHCFGHEIDTVLLLSMEGNKKLASRKDFQRLTRPIAS